MPTLLALHRAAWSVARRISSLPDDERHNRDGTLVSAFGVRAMEPEPARIISNQIAHGCSDESFRRSRRTVSVGFRHVRHVSEGPGLSNPIKTASGGFGQHRSHDNFGTNIMGLSELPDRRHLSASGAAIGQPTTPGGQSRLEGREELSGHPPLRGAVPKRMICFAWIAVGPSGSVVAARGAASRFSALYLFGL